MKQKEDCKTSFYIAIITPDGKTTIKEGGIIKGLTTQEKQQ